MSDVGASRLRLLAAEIRAEVERIERTVEELEQARGVLSAEAPSRLESYGAAALLDTFYSGIEKAMLRIAGVFGEEPKGSAWHRKLLEEMTLEVPRLRPAVLSSSTAPMLEPFLAFRHRFRHLYLFDLRKELLTGLLADARGAWEATRSDLEAYARTLEILADEIEQRRT